MALTTIPNTPPGGLQAHREEGRGRGGRGRRNRRRAGEGWVGPIARVGVWKSLPIRLFLYFTIQFRDEESSCVTKVAIGPLTKNCLTLLEFCYSIILESSGKFLQQTHVEPEKNLFERKM